MEKKKILLLDDKDVITKVLGIYLGVDYDIHNEPNGISGINYLTTSGIIPDAII